MYGFASEAYIARRTGGLPRTSALSFKSPLRGAFARLQPRYFDHEQRKSDKASTKSTKWVIERIGAVLCVLGETMD